MLPRTIRGFFQQRPDQFVAKHRRQDPAPLCLRDRPVFSASRSRCWSTIMASSAGYLFSISCLINRETAGLSPQVLIAIV